MHFTFAAFEAVIRFSHNEERIETRLWGFTVIHRGCCRWARWAVLPPFVDGAWQTFEERGPPPRGEPRRAIHAPFPKGHRFRAPSGRFWRPRCTLPRRRDIPMRTSWHTDPAGLSVLALLWFPMTAKEFGGARVPAEFLPARFGPIGRRQCTRRARALGG